MILIKIILIIFAIVFILYFIKHFDAIRFEDLSDEEKKKLWQLNKIIK